MEKIVLTVGDHVLPEHVRQIRNGIAAEAHEPVVINSCVDTLFVSGLELKAMYAGNRGVLETARPNFYYRQLAAEHLRTIGAVSRVIFDERTLHYARGPVAEHLDIVPAIGCYVSSLSGLERLTSVSDSH